MEALARAGSPREDAGPFILINHRPVPGRDSAPAEERLSITDLLTGKAQGIVLRDGDTIFVPKAETFFVTGQVRNPGPYLLESDVTIARAVSMAGGITERGSRSRIRVTRTIDGKQVVLKSVKLEDLVLPGDSIEVLARVF
jgi:polysaccharide biosynthesis/export protein